MATCATPVVPQRVLPSYSVEEQEEQRMKRSIFQTQFQLNQMKEEKKVYENQVSAAKEIVASLKDRTKVITLVLGNTQSGKTGVMVSLLNQIMEDDELNQTPVDNICVLTALSSVEWDKQTKQRFPECIHKQIFHLPSLKKKFLPYVKDKKDVLVLIDEAQYGAKSSQTIHKVFDELRYVDLSTMCDKNIRIVMFTATPSGINYDLNDWGVHATRVFLKEGEGYTSAKNLLEMGNLRQYKNLCGINMKGENTCTPEELEENLTELRNAVYSFEEPRYHFIRISTRGIMKTTLRRNIKRTFGDSVNYVNYSMKNKMKDINELLSVKPDKHTIIYIMERLRCAKTIVKQFIGVMVERHTHSLINDEVVVQGVRLTGYDYNGDAIMFTNIESTDKFSLLRATGFQGSAVEWNSSTTRNTGKEKILKVVPTFISRNKADNKADNKEVKEN